jgi:hypothetical protein
MRKKTVLQIGAQLPELALTVWLAASKGAPAPTCSLDGQTVLTFNQ